jgi:hypothetical protein
VRTPFFSCVARSASVVPPALHSSTKAATSGRVRAACVRQRMLGRDGAEGHAHDRVGARGEDVHAAALHRLRPTSPRMLVREGEAHALAACRSSSPASARTRSGQPRQAVLTCVEQLVGVLR